MRKVDMLTNFLVRAKQLRGFGDMDSYRLVNDFGKLSEEVDEGQVHMIICEFSSQKTYDIGKQHFIQGIKSLMDDAHWDSNTV